MKPRFDFCVRKIPWQPTSVFLPGEFHGQRSLVGYNPQGCKESDMTEVVTQQLHLEQPSFFPGNNAQSLNIEPTWL